MAKLYKPTPPTSFLERIALILRKEYMAEEQGRIVEKNTDTDGSEFVMVRDFRQCDDCKYLLYRFDMRPGELLFPFPYFSLKDADGNGLGVAKSCDYVMFAERGGEAYIILIELKLGKDDPKPQLDQMRFFIEFIQKRAARAGIDINAKVRMLGVSDVVMKMSTKMGNKVIYENDFAQLYDGTFIRLSELVK